MKRPPRKRKARPLLKTLVGVAAVSLAAACMEEEAIGNPKMPPDLGVDVGVDIGNPKTPPDLGETD